jgi:DNA processing protein
MPSEKGRKAARDAAHAIASHGAIVVSGGAVGVDWAAHDAMVLSGRQTLVILPQGIATYPLPGRWRYAREEGRLLLVSPYLPNASWRTHAAVSRNALISAQAQLVCVIEPRSQGGSILTTRHAVNQQKAVFAEPLSSLPASLRPHAQPLSGFRDALSSYTWESPELLPNDRQPDLF